ncbi:hypothetical protein AB1Y20_011280 [Prymnesium parvum]|uniref:Calponin-homology (CH) domain-containing protein n=1 Tax=Prymnesium parvum TaxID=97485 RepID=A0AB34IMY5_PRYPA
MAEASPPSSKAAKEQAMEEQAREWIEAVLGESFEGLSTPDALKDGTRLCRLVNALQPGSCPPPSTSPKPFKQMENVAAYLDACSSLGVRPFDLFQTVELFEAKNMRNVITNIHALGRAAQRLGFNGPTLGPKMATATPRRFSTEQMAAARAAPTFLNKGSSESVHKRAASDTARAIVRGDPGSAEAAQERTEAKVEERGETEGSSSCQPGSGGAGEAKKLVQQASPSAPAAAAPRAEVAPRVEKVSHAESSIGRKGAASPAATEETDAARKARAWVEAVLGDRLDSAPLSIVLRDGVTLCRLANAVKADVCAKPSTSKTPFKQMENISAYLKACEKLGMRPFEMFQTADLFEAKNMRAVVANIHAMSKVAAKVHRHIARSHARAAGSTNPSSHPQHGFTGPKIGEMGEGIGRPAVARAIAFDQEAKTASEAQGVEQRSGTWRDRGVGAAVDVEEATRVAAAAWRDAEEARAAETSSVASAEAAAVAAAACRNEAKASEAMNSHASDGTGGGTAVAASAKVGPEEAAAKVLAVEQAARAAAAVRMTRVAEAEAAKAAEDEAARLAVARAARVDEGGGHVAASTRRSYAEEEDEDTEEERMQRAIMARAGQEEAERMRTLIRASEEPYSGGHVQDDAWEVELSLQRPPPAVRPPFMSTSTPLEATSPPPKATSPPPMAPTPIASPPSVSAHHWRDGAPSLRRAADVFVDTVATTEQTVQQARNPFTWVHAAALHFICVIRCFSQSLESMENARKAARAAAASSRPAYVEAGAMPTSAAGAHQTTRAVDARHAGHSPPGHAGAGGRQSSTYAAAEALDIHYISKAMDEVPAPDAELLISLAAASEAVNKMGQRVKQSVRDMTVNLAEEAAAAAARAENAMDYSQSLIMTESELTSERSKVASLQASLSASERARQNEREEFARQHEDLRRQLDLVMTQHGHTIKQLTDTVRLRKEAEQQRDEALHSLALAEGELKVVKAEAKASRAQGEAALREACEEKEKIQLMRQNLALMRSESGQSRDPLVVANFLEGHPQSKSPPIPPPPHPPTAAISSSQLLHNPQPTPPARDVQSTNQRLAQVRAQVAAEEAAAMALEEELTKRSSSTAVRKPPSYRSDPQTATSASERQTDTEKGALMPSRGLHDMTNPSAVVEAHTHSASSSALPDRASSQPRSTLAAGTEPQPTQSRDGTSLQLDASDLIRSLELESLVARTLARDESDNVTQFDRTREATRALIQQILHDMGANLARADAEGESACSTHPKPHTQKVGRRRKLNLISHSRIPLARALVPLSALLFESHLLHILKQEICMVGSNQLISLNCTTSF